MGIKSSTGIGIVSADENNNTSLRHVIYGRVASKPPKMGIRLISLTEIVSIAYQYMGGDLRVFVKGTLIKSSLLPQYSVPKLGMFLS